MFLGVIPARGNSKGVPRKNLRPCFGKPLIAWSIESAQQAELLDDFIVSTEDPEIADIAKSYGARVLIRPADLAKDETTTLAVIQHVLEEIPSEAVVVLQPTSPIRDDDLIDRCISQFNETLADCLATGYYCKLSEYGSHDNLPRQKIDGFFYDDGNIYILKKELIQAGKWTGDRKEHFLLSGDQNYEIDSELDLYILEKLLEKRMISRISRCGRNIRLLATDVDGVLTDGGMYYSPQGEELKKFNTRDGKGLELIRETGIKVALITQEESKSVQSRAEKLNVDYYRSGVQNKLKALEGIARDIGITLDQIAYIGDDLNDTEALQKVGFSATPEDGAIQNKMIVDYICKKQGGRGCVREICDLILSV